MSSSRTGELYRPTLRLFAVQTRPHSVAVKKVWIISPTMSSAGEQRKLSMLVALTLHIDIATNRRLLDREIHRFSQKWSRATCYN